MDNSSNDPQARNTAHEALAAIDTALHTPGVQEELAKQGADISTSEVEAALAAKLTELADIPVVHAHSLSAAAIFQESPSTEPLAQAPAPELEPWAQDPAAKAPDAQASLEDRVAALENSVAQMRDIMLHHGLRGPQ